MLTSDDVVAIRSGAVEWHCAVAKAHALRVVSAPNDIELALRVKAWFRFRAGLSPRALVEAVELFTREVEGN